MDVTNGRTGAAFAFFVNDRGQFVESTTTDMESRGCTALVTYPNGLQMLETYDGRHCISNEPVLSGNELAYQV
jgi:hypothetical protein